MKKSKKKSLILESKIKFLEEKVEKLEKRLFAKKTTNPFYNYEHMFFLMAGKGFATRDISLEEKIDLIAKHLNVEFDVKPATDSEAVLVVTKKEKTYGTKRRIPRTATEAAILRESKTYKQSKTSKKRAR